MARKAHDQDRRYADRGCDPAVRTYDFTTVVNRSTIDKIEPGKGSRETNVIYVSCWDAGVPDTRPARRCRHVHAQTFRLSSERRHLRSTRTRTGHCSESSDASFEEVFTLKWTLRKDDTLSGRAVQEFTGCSGEPQQAVYRVSAESGGPVRCRTSRRLPSTT